MEFWRRYPALLYGVSITLSFLLVFESLWFALPLGTMIMTLPRKMMWIPSLLVIACILFAKVFYLFPPSGLRGTAVIQVESLKETTSRFGSATLYQGKLLSFVPEEEEKSVASNVPCRIYLPKGKAPPPASSYRVKGRLKTRSERAYTLKFDRNAIWEPLSTHLPLAHHRFHAKKKVARYIQRHISKERAGLFLTGLVTGIFDDRVLCKEFGDLGLAHLLALSGFHFAILATIFQRLFRLALPPRICAIALLVVLSIYFLFIGKSPSIQRAWIVAMLVLFGQLLNKPTLSLNSLGVALLASCILDPLSCRMLSFQLSFLATAGILLFFSPFDTLLKHFFPKELSNRFLSQCIRLFRGSFALILAVHMMTLPLLLFTFHKFPLNSLLYNLFFPFLVSCALFIFIVTLPLPFLHPLCGWITEGILSLAESPPLSCNTWYFYSLNPGVLAIVLTLIFLGGMLLEKRRHSDFVLSFW